MVSAENQLVTGKHVQAVQNVYSPVGCDAGCSACLSAIRRSQSRTAVAARPRPQRGRECGARSRCGDRDFRRRARRDRHHLLRGADGYEDVLAEERRHRLHVHACSAVNVHHVLLEPGQACALRRLLAGLDICHLTTFHVRIQLLVDKASCSINCCAARDQENVGSTDAPACQRTRALAAAAPQREPRAAPRSRRTRAARTGRS
jgi:hypothetical protein